MTANIFCTRRIALVTGFSALTAMGSQEVKPTLPDDSFRYRWTTVDELFRRARKARAEQTISYSTYVAIVHLLREEELSIFDEAAKHQFSDVTESNYWHRSRLKFPSDLQTEQRLLNEGKDPALKAP